MSVVLDGRQALAIEAVHALMTTRFPGRYIDEIRVGDSPSGRAIGIFVEVIHHDGNVNDTDGEMREERIIVLPDGRILLDGERIVLHRTLEGLRLVS